MIPYKQNISKHDHMANEMLMDTPSSDWYLYFKIWLYSQNIACMIKI